MTPRQLPNETEKAFRAFEVYVGMGERRSLVKAAKKIGIGRDTLRDWSHKYTWQKRIKAMLLAEQDLNAEVEEQAKLELAREREKFRRDVDKFERDTFYTTMAQIEELKKMPLVRPRFKKDYAKNRDGSFVLDSDGNKVSQTIVWMPVNANVLDVVRMAQLASTMGRLNQGLPTGRHELTSPNGKPLIPTLQPIVNVTLHRDAISDQAKQIEAEFFKRHPEFKRRNNGVI
jgi:hypothetical protein